MLGGKIKHSVAHSAISYNFHFSFVLTGEYSKFSLNSDPPHPQIKTTFLASPATGCGHVTKFWLKRGECLTVISRNLPEDTVKGAAFPLCQPCFLRPAGLNTPRLAGDPETIWEYELTLGMAAMQNEATN